MRLGVLLAMFAVLGYSPWNANAQDKPLRHVEKEAGFSIEAPANWEIRELPGFKYKFVAGPAADGFAPNICFLDEAFAGTLKEYATASKKALQALAKGYKEIADGELIIENEHNGTVLRQTFFVFDLAPGKKLVVTCSALAKGGEMYDVVFEASIKTIRVEKK
jgi:hypothetical protein